MGVSSSWQHCQFYSPRVWKCNYSAFLCSLAFNCSMYHLLRTLSLISSNSFSHYYSYLNTLSSCFIFRQSCRGERPKNAYWAVGFVREQLDVSEDVQISRLWRDFGREGLGRQFEEKCLIGQQRSEGLTCHQGQHFGQFYL